MTLRRVILISIVLCCITSLSYAEPVCKLVDSRWTWFGDHIIASITYHIVIAENKNAEVGTGMMLFGKPRGTVQELQGKVAVTAFGLGAIHVRAEGGASVKVCVSATGPIPITIIRDNF